MIQSCMITIWTMFVSLMCTLLTHILLYIFYLLQGCLTHKHGVSLLPQIRSESVCSNQFNCYACVRHQIEANDALVMPL